jgi:hypothetical protein
MSFGRRAALLRKAEVETAGPVEFEFRHARGRCGCWRLGWDAIKLRWLA